MSLLLDARKKSLQAQASQEGSHAALPELSLEEHPQGNSAQPGTNERASRPEEAARSAGKNLFGAKSARPPSGRAMPDRRLLLALGGTVLLLVIGAGYLWYIGSASDTTPLRPISAPPAAPVPQIQAGSDSAAAQPALVPGIAEPGADASPQQAAQPAAPAEYAPVAVPQPRASSPIRIERQNTGRLDPLLEDAYAAYRNGRLDEAQQLYLSLFRKDARNPDALLGLAAIAQQRGDNLSAAQYYGRVLDLDPRNPVANAGMSALSVDDGYNESRLKNLLREQGNSATLHFALGNLYAGQSRWGEAQQAYFNAYTLEPGNAEFAFNLAVSLEHLGQNRLAAQHYQRALQLDPSHSAGFDHAQISQRIPELSR